MLSQQFLCKIRKLRDLQKLVSRIHRIHQMYCETVFKINVGKTSKNMVETKKVKIQLKSSKIVFKISQFIEYNSRTFSRITVLDSLFSSPDLSFTLNDDIAFAKFFFVIPFGQASNAKWKFLISKK